jgi:Family of unknown function (DUF6328)
VRRMSEARTGAGGAPGAEESARETRKERVDRELLELLNELRVALPGVQILFAFLLIVPFQQSAARTDDFQRDVYFLTLLGVCVATGLLIAPAAQHRVLFRMHDKEGLLHRSSRSAYAGLLFLAFAITCAVLLVTDMLFSRTQAWVTAGAVAALLVWWWVAVPFWQRAHSTQEHLQSENRA